MNNLFAWYDEALLDLSSPLREKIEEGIQSSQGFLLLHSHVSSNSSWVQLEMKIAKEKYEADPNFKIFVVKLDNTDLDSFWTTFLYNSWDHQNKESSAISLLETLTQKKGLLRLTNSALLNNIPHDYSINESGTIAEHTRNFMVYNIAHIKGSLLSISKTQYPNEAKDSISKLLNTHLFESIPALAGGLIRIGNGELEFIYSNRMRVPPQVLVNGVPSEYSVSIIRNDEIVTRLKVTNTTTGEPVNHSIPISIQLSAEL